MPDDLSPEPFLREKETALHATVRRLSALLDAGSADGYQEALLHAGRILDSATPESLEHCAEILNRTCFYLFEVNQSMSGIALGKRIAESAERCGLKKIVRRIFNILGVQYGDIADFATAMDYLEKAIVLARQIGGDTVEIACLANVVSVLQEFGHYRQAIELAKKILRSKEESHVASMLKLQCASNGLFSAQRIGDTDSARQFVEAGIRYLRPDVEPLRRVFFEKNRIAYLIDCGDVSSATVIVDDIVERYGSLDNPRIRTLIAISSALCMWAEGDKTTSRSALRELYVESKASRLYHHFVLQALIKVHGDADLPSTASDGLRYARELVAFTTSVKKAKFYRQLANQRQMPARAGFAATATSIDPFDAARAWLDASDVAVPPDDLDQRRELVKHEELAAIHEDMAQLRAISIRRDIRTDAVNTAENWAIAAEFFDDETGQHCYRVGHLASMLARAIGMDETFCIQVEHAARLHDIGKIAVNEVILLKPGPLDAAEMAAMRLHTEVGAQILAGSDDPTLRMAAEVARHHHEWWNGAGYPTKRCGKEIPLSARLCAYADVYDALTHMRAYKKAWTHERAVDEIRRLRGVQFDPDLFDPFIDVLTPYRTDLDARAIPGFADMLTNGLIASRRKLMETISGTPA